MITVVMKVNLAGFRHSSCVIFSHYLFILNNFLFLHILHGERGEGVLVSVVSTWEVSARLPHSIQIHKF